MSVLDRVRPTSRERRAARVGARTGRGSLAPLLYLVPFLVFFTIFQIYPIFQGLYVSLTKWDLVTEPRFVGLENYGNLLNDALFWTALRNTGLFVALNAPLAVVVPLGLAMLVNESIPGRTIFRSAFTTPLMISVSSVGVLWVWFLNPTFGLINHYAAMLGLPGQNWLTQSGWAMFAVVITTVWWTSGWNLVLFLAGLQEIPEQLYDAAKIDGAGNWALFRYVTLPGLRATLLFVGVTTVIGSFRVFGQVFVMTGGGPFDSTRTVVQHIYESGFRYFRMGGASAVAWALFVIVLVFTVIQFRLVRDPEQ
ncbi:MAG: sugar ABC transporter permease [Chloroflexota bacterium]|nr:MAG: ABC transporter permease [Chloroflexota bacterium]